MQYRAIIQVLGLFLVLFSTTLLPPLAVSAYYADGAHDPFIAAYFGTLLTGLILWLPVRKMRAELRVREGFVVVSLFWAVLAAFGALPLVFANHPHMHLAAAYFESMSGLTTTGATVLTGIDNLPKSILYYRQQLQWLGGMGIIVLAVAVMPMLGVGGMQLFRAETPGPMKDTKLTPRISETAKALWYIYLGLTLACALAYWIAGMNLFDAVGHAFSTLSTGGFSTHDQSLGYFHNSWIDIICMVFMVIAGANFALHFMVWRGRDLRLYFRDSEVKAYLAVLLGVGGVCVAVLVGTHSIANTAHATRDGLFHVISVVTSTGFTTNGFAWWPLFLPVLVMASACVGGCAGSTAGGIKVIRVLLLYKQGKREMNRLVHPNALLPVKLGRRPVSDHVIDAVWAFFFLYALCLVVLSLAMIATGLDPVSAVSAVIACINNMGPGLGSVTTNFAGVSPVGQWILSFTMLLGRLELFTLLVLFTPAFWKG